MNSNHINRRKQPESGVALLIAIFVLMLVSVVAISLIVSSGGESALAGNYRSSASAYLAGAAGLEEARGRLLSSNSDYFNNTVPNFIPVAGPLLLGQVRYIVNPAQGENAATLLAAYPDTEYATEFGAAPIAANVLTVPSVSKVVSGGTTYYGPLYKWVRITPATEKSIDTDVNGGGKDFTAPLYYDGAHLPQPSLIVPPMIGLNPNPPGTAKQAYEITALAVLPNGSQKILQYLVAPPKNLVFGAAISLPGTHMFGNDVTFDYPNYGGGSSNFYVDGRDYPCSGFSPTANPPVVGLGYTDSTPPDYGSSNPSYVQPAGNYQGSGGTPSVYNDSTALSQTFQTPAKHFKSVEHAIYLVLAETKGFATTLPLF